MTTLTGFQAPNLVKILLDSAAEGTLQAYRMLWGIAVNIITQNWGAILILLSVVLVVAFLLFLMTRRWKMLGSVLYNYIYFGIMLFIGLIFGPEAYANDYFPIVALVVYVIAFAAVGVILVRIGIKRR